MIADRVQRVGLSATLRVDAAAKRLRSEGVDVVNLGVGEPDFPTPQHIGDAGKRAIDERHTHYTINAGIPELRQAICERLGAENGVHYAPEEIIVSAGAKQSLFNACMAILNAGDEAIIPAPYWVSYPEMANLLGAVPVVVPTREADGFRLTPEALRRALTPKSRLLFLNNPCNPTGAAYPRADLAALAEVAVGANLMILADEIYEKLVYDGFGFVSIASLGEEIRNRTIRVSGVSKAYAMTGWRIGYASGPREIISAMGVVQSHSTSNACSISQWASLEALRGPQDGVDSMVAEFKHRRDAVVDGVRSVPGWTCVTPQGAFYVFPNVTASLNTTHDGRRIQSAMDLSEYLLERAHVAVVPGEAFGAEGFIRISYATSLDRLREGLERIRRAVGELKPAAGR